MIRHAYLIMAHNNIDQLKILLQFLDYLDNDIFVHIDRKSRDMMALINKKNNYFELKYSNLVFVNSIDVHWGGYSQIKAEMILIKKAMESGKYERLHLLSGMDLPIKSQKYIHGFFELHHDEEFLLFDFNKDEKTIYNRVGLHHFLIDKISRKNKFLNKIENITLGVQKMFHVNRVKNDGIVYMKGANWFSITGNFAEYVLENERRIMKTYKNTKCCDEIFMQTLAYNSNFRKKLYFDDGQERFHNMRLIDWKRGNPYVFLNEDFNEIMSSPYLFARKFDLNIDSKIVHELIKIFKED